MDAKYSQEKGSKLLIQGRNKKKVGKSTYT